MSHYTEGRRYSHIHKAWILESGWNDSEEIAALRAQLAARDAEVGRLKRATELCASQAEDEGLWFIAETITEDYLQRALRALHRVIEE